MWYALLEPKRMSYRTREMIPRPVAGESAQRRRDNVWCRKRDDGVLDGNGPRAVFRCCTVGRSRSGGWNQTTSIQTLKRTNSCAFRS